MDTEGRRALIVTALPVERQAVLEHLQTHSEETHARGSVYRRAIFSDRSKPWEVLLAEIGPGNEPAAAAVERAVAYFEPQVALFVGVAGAIKDLNRGDVVAATKVYSYEGGKDRDDYFETRPEVGEPSYALRERARYEAGEPSWRLRIKDCDNQGASDSAVPEARAAPIAAGAKVLASNKSALYAFIRRHYGDAVAVEMEGHGFLVAVHMNRDVHGIVIRGISDCLADKEPHQDQL